MAYDDIVLGAASNSKIIEVMLRDSTTGQGKTALAYGDVTYFYIREGTTSTHEHGTCVDMTLDTYADHGFIQVDSTNCPGLYQFGVPQAALATGKNAVTIHLKATGVINKVVRILIMGSDLRAAALAADMKQVLGTAITEGAGAGKFAGAMTKFFNVATPTGTINSIPDAVAGAASGLAIVGSSMVAGSIANDAITAAATAVDFSTEVNAAVLSAISGIGSGTGAALNFAVYDDNTDGALAAIVAPLGSPQGATTFSNTLANDNTNHVIAAAQVGGTGNYKIDWLYAFNVGAGRAASKVVLRAMSGAANDTITVSAYNFLTPGWEVRTTFASAAETLYDIPLLAGHTGTGADAGKVYIRLAFDEADGGTLTIDEAYVLAQNLGQTVGYADGAIWIGGANTGTTPYVDGTADNPCTYAASKTLSASLGISRFRVRNGTTITLDATIANQTFIGKNWTLALGNQAITSAYIEGATVSGLSTGDGCHFNDCHFTAATTLAKSHFILCGFDGVITMVAAKKYNLINCFDDDTSTASNPTFLFPGTGNNSLGLRNWKGGVEVSGMASGDTATCDGTGGRLVIDSTCASGSTITLRGPWSYTDEGTYGGTLTQTQRYGTDLINAQCDLALADIHLDHLFATAVAIPAVVPDTFWDTLIDDGTASYNRTTDSLQAIRDRGDAAWITATGFSTHTAANVITAMGTGTFLTAIPWNATWDAEVQSECDDAITANTLVKRLMPGMAGTISGAGTGTEVFVYGGVTMTVTVDANGNRSVVAWS